MQVSQPPFDVIKAEAGATTGTVTSRDAMLGDVVGGRRKRLGDETNCVFTGDGKARARGERDLEAGELEESERAETVEAVASPTLASGARPVAGNSINESFAQRSPWWLPR